MRVEPAVSLRGDIAVPGDKSISHRALLLAAVADGESELDGFGDSEDTLSTARAVRALGAEADVDGARVRVRGVGLRGLREPAEALDCGNAGTLMRLLAGILAGQEGRFELVGDESLSRRPLERIAEPLGLMGARVETTHGHAPLRVERLLEAAGARVGRKPGAPSVWPAERLRPLRLAIPGDFSAAAPFILAATLIAESEVRLHGVGVNPTRIGFLTVLERMGARIAVFNRRMMGGEPVADLEVQSAELVAAEVGPEEVPGLVDELPLFALAAGMAHGESVVTGAQELRVKESDRLETVKDALRPLGIRIETHHDGFRVRGVPTRPKGGGVVEAGGDHRIAMLGAIAGLVSREGVELQGAESVAVSFPDFFAMVDALAQR
jgi:3-phosphoshikimate 1-carboxyvinyltransferase